MEISSPNHHLKSHSSKNETTTSESVKRNAYVFGVLMVFLQIAFSLIYGFLIEVKPAQLNVASTVITAALALLVVAGFGLVFGYTRRLVWSGIGFTFFITAFCIEVYPLINDFWTRVGLQSNVKVNFDIDNRMFNLFLSDRETALGGKATYYGNSISNALKCALSISVAFSSLVGRVGQLECLIVTMLGIVGFELNRQIIQQSQGTDTFGTFFIFTFGGFMGLGLGLLSHFRERKALSQLDRASMKKYTGSEHSALYSLLGALIIFALFPLLSYEFDAYSRYNAYSPYFNPVCIIVAMGAGAVASISLSLLINGELIVRDATHGVIAGAISVGASSLYITNPVFAFVAGAAGGIVQAIIQNLIEKRAAKLKFIISTVSWSLFGLQGIIGAGFAAGWKAIYFTNTSGRVIEDKTLSLTSQFQFYGGLISAGIGCVFGLVAGLLVILVNKQRSKEYFEDSFYWFSSDGIKYEGVKVHEGTMKPLPIPVSAPEIVVEPDFSVDHKSEEKKHEEVKSAADVVQHIESEVSEEHIIENLSEDLDQFDFSEAYETIVNPYAYL